jgi:hypothetical protein
MQLGRQPKRFLGLLIAALCEQREAQRCVVVGASAGMLLVQRERCMSFGFGTLGLA